MTENLKSKRLLEELSQAVERGLLSREVYQLAERGVLVRGDMVGSVVVSGDNNIVTVSPLAGAISVEGKNESSLLTEAVANYQTNLVEQRKKIADLPYPGLLAHRIQDAPHFFGRQQAVTDLLADLGRARVIWAHGRSGTGKSSLIQAGLLPALLDKGEYPILVRPFDEHPTAALKKELLKRNWSGELELAKLSLLAFLAQVEKNARQPLVVIFDQFEEFFTKVPEADRGAFVRELADCLADTNLQARFIFSLRSDYFGDTARLRERLSAGESREFFLRPLTVEEARRAITGPLEGRGIVYQDGLVDTILGHLGGGDVVSPQLQLVCERLFRTLPADCHEITSEHYQSQGGTEGILGEYLKQAIRDQQVIPAAQQKAAAYLLSTLVTPEGERDAKRIADWVADARLRSMTFAWLAGRENLPLTRGMLDRGALRQLAVMNYVRQIEAHVSIHGEELRQLVQEISEPILDAYIFREQVVFTYGLVQSLQSARLLHEVQTEDGELAYELVHDYLIPEVRSWLDADEVEARRLRRMLDQKLLDFDRHKFLLDAQELELLASQLENPMLGLRESDRRLILLSAAAHGTGSPWLTIVGSDGLNWLREAWQDAGMPDAVRRGAAACLGENDDQPTYHQLLDKVQQEKTTATRSNWFELLAHYLNRSLQAHRLPWRVNRSVFPRVARLKVREGAGERARMSRVAAYLVPLCVLLIAPSIAVSDLVLKTVGLIVFALIGGILAFLFAQVMTSLALIAHRWQIGWRVFVMAFAGVLLGSILFLFVAGEMRLGLAGGVIGIAQALLLSRWKQKPSAAVVAVSAAAAVFVLGVLALEKANPWMEADSAFSASLFSGVYLYFACRMTR